MKTHELVPRRASNRGNHTGAERSGGVANKSACPLQSPVPNKLERFRSKSRGSHYLPINPNSLQPNRNASYTDTHRPPLRSTTNKKHQPRRDIDPVPARCSRNRPDGGAKQTGGGPDLASLHQLGFPTARMPSRAGQAGEGEEERTNLAGAGDEASGERHGWWAMRLSPSSPIGFSSLGRESEMGDGTRKWRRRLSLRFVRPPGPLPAVRSPQGSRAPSRADLKASKP